MQNNDNYPPLGRASSTPALSPLSYEYPLTEKIRNYLRLEHLFIQLRHHWQQDSAWDHRACLATLFELLTLLENTSLKTDLLGELDYYFQGLNVLLDHNKVDQQKLVELLDEIKSAGQQLMQLESRLRQRLREQELLKVIRQRSAMPAGTCNFDLPAFHYWLSQPAQRRRELLSVWLNELNPLNHGLGLILRLLRSSAEFKLIKVQNGYHALDASQVGQTLLIRLQLEPGCGYYPEISGNRHRLTLRFLTPNDINQRARQIQSSVSFQLACCKG